MLKDAANVMMCRHPMILHTIYITPGILPNVSGVLQAGDFFFFKILRMQDGARRPSWRMIICTRASANWSSRTNIFKQSSFHGNSTLEAERDLCKDVVVYENICTAMLMIMHFAVVLEIEIWSIAFLQVWKRRIECHYSYLPLISIQLKIDDISRTYQDLINI